MYLQKFISRYITTITILIILITILNSGCARENDSWLKAKEENTILGYEKYLERFQNGSHADSARNKIEKLKSERHPAFRNVMTIRLLEDFNLRYYYYNTTSTQSITFPLYDETIEFLTYAGFNVVKANAKKYDATVEIESNGHTSPSHRVIRSGQLMWSLAQISGTISIKLADSVYWAKDFEGEYARTYKVGNEIYTANPSPPLDLMFFTRMLESVETIFGPSTGAAAQRSLRKIWLHYLESDKEKD